jgi:hypothetical protein
VSLGKEPGWALQMLWTTRGQILSILIPLPRPRCHPHRNQSDRRFNRSSTTSELRLTATCGKDRTRFPQVGGTYLFEIPHPVDPEIWEWSYNFNVRLTVTFTETRLYDLYLY